MYRIALGASFSRIIGILLNMHKYDLFIDIHMMQIGQQIGLQNLISLLLASLLWTHVSPLSLSLFLWMM